MTARTILVWVLLGAAALVTLLSCVALATMRDALQRLHYVAPPATLASALVTIALFVDEHDADARGKAVLVTIALTMMNGVATHATARAARIRDHGTWVPVAGERVPVRGRDAVVPPVRPEHHPSEEPS